METSVPPVRPLSWRVPAIDGLRAFAMLMVFAFHTWEFSSKPELNIALGEWHFNALALVKSFPAGVDLFMVLSGFCLFLPLCKEGALQKWRLGPYFVRRVRRIAPPYYAAILYAIVLPQILVFLFHLIGIKADWQPIPSAFQIVTHLLFIHTLFIEAWNGINGSFWSLGLEAQFYLAFPIAVWGFSRFGTRFFWAMIAISIFYRVGVYWFFNITGKPLTADREFVLSIFFLGRWMQFALGMAAAWLVASQWKSGRQFSAAQGTGFIVGAIMFYLLAVSPLAALSGSFPLPSLLLGMAFAFAIVGLCASKSPLRAPFENRYLTGLGFISYSVFLIHQPTVWYLSEFLRKFLKVDGLAMLAALWTIGFAVVIAISYGFFLLFERPFLNTKKLTTEDKTPQNVAAVDAAQHDVASIMGKEVLSVQDQSVP